MTNYIRYLFISSIILAGVSCAKKKIGGGVKDEPTDIQIRRVPFDRPADFSEGYDSVKCFKDVDLGTLKGKDAVEEEGLVYPFIALKYRQDDIDLVSYWSKTISRKWVIKKAPDFRYSEFTYWENSQLRHEYVTAVFPLNGNVIYLYTLDRPFDVNAESVKPATIIIDKMPGGTKLLSKIYNFHMSLEPMPIKDILQLNKGKLDKSFLEYWETTREIRKNKLVETRDYEYKLQEKKVIVDRQRNFVMEYNFLYPSFAYYYMHDQVKLKKSIP